MGAKQQGESRGRPSHWPLRWPQGRTWKLTRLPLQYGHGEERCQRRRSAGLDAKAARPTVNGPAQRSTVRQTRDPEETLAAADTAVPLKVDAGRSCVRTSSARQ